MKVINFVNSDECAVLQSEFKSNNYLVLELNTDEISEIDEVYARLTNVFPLGMPLSGVTNWDAFLDATWEAFTEQPQKNIVVFWKGSERMIENRLSVFVTVAGVLTALSVSLVNDPPGGYNLLIYIVGDGKNYA